MNAGVVAGVALIALPFVVMLVDSLVEDGLWETLECLFAVALIAATLTGFVLLVGAVER